MKTDDLSLSVWNCAIKQMVLGIALAINLSGLSVHAENITLQWDQKQETDFERINLADSCRLTIKASSSQQLCVVLGRIDARSQMLYRIEAAISAKNIKGDAVAVLSVRWLNEDGKDASIDERALGYKDSTLKAAVPPGWSGQPVMLSLTGPASRTTIRRGQVELLLTAPQAGELVEITAVRIQEGNASTCTAVDTEDSAITVKQGDSSCHFSHNLVPNASFEDGGNSTVTGWRYEGAGVPHTGNGGYAGKRCLLLKTDNADGRWLSAPAPITPDIPVWLCYWTRFSEYARPAGHANPMQFEFLRQDKNGAFIPLPLSKHWQFEGGKYFALYGQWFPVATGPVIPPAGATHVRAFTRYHDSNKSWTAEPFIANWGEIAIDNVILWQSACPPVSSDWKISPYGDMLAGAKSVLPPFVPLGNRRDNSVTMFPVRQADANLFFADDGPMPAIKIRLGSMLPVTRNVTIEGKVLDWNGKTISIFSNSAVLTPYAVSETALPIKAVTQYGVYLIELSAAEGTMPCGKSTVRFAWLRRPYIDDAIRHHEQYPFDMHPTDINADFESMNDHEEIDFQMRVMKLLGVRGIRLQSRYHLFDFTNPELAAAAARRKVENWRQSVLPVMQKYGIEGWISLMEQGSNNTRAPKSEADFRAWHDYNYAQVKSFGSDVQFFLFGNEGLGGHTPDDPDQNCLTKSAFAGTTRDWMKAYQAAWRAAKEANPLCFFGPSQASDVNALVIQRFYRILGAEGKFDCWGFNAYGNSAEMGKNIFTELKKHDAPNVFGVIPEVGLDVPAFGNARVPGERRQAATLVQTYLNILAEAPWIRRIAWFTLYGGRGVEGHQIFDADWTPRPAAAAYLVMTEHLGAGKVEKKIELPGGGEFIVWRKIDGSVVGIGWSSTEQTITLDTGVEQIVADDIFGNRQTVKTVNGTAGVLLSEVPVYVIGAGQLEQSRLFEINASNITAVANGSAVVALDIRNNGGNAENMTILAQAHPLIKISPPSVSLLIEPGKIARQKFKLSFLQTNDRIRNPLTFQATTGKGMTFRVKMSDTFACCVRAPADFSLDGTWQSWTRAQILHADQRTQVEQPMGVAWKGPDDVSARIMTMWDKNYFYLGLQVHDDVFFAKQLSNRMFLNDAVEIGFDLEHRLSGNSRLWQFVMGKSESGNTLFCHQPGTGFLVPTPPAKMFIQPTGNGGDVDYQVAIPWSQLGSFMPEAGRQIGFGVIVDDSDGKPNDRKFISWFGSGISSKRPQELGDLIFVE